MQVAPFTGAWIETQEKATLLKSQESRPLRARGLKLTIKGHGKMEYHVAPFTGAWIETICWCGFRREPKVAPFTGAWIETLPKFFHASPSICRALYGRVD